MPVTVMIPVALQQAAGGNSQIEVEGTTAGEVLERLIERHEDLRGQLYNDRNRLRNFVNVYLNDEDIRYANGVETPVKDGDRMMIVPAMAGGRSCRELQSASSS